MFDFEKEFHNVNSINGIRDGLIPFLITHLTQNNNIFYIARNDIELSLINQFIKFNFEEINIFTLPSWDCLPFDISSPNYKIISERVKTLSDLSLKLENEKENNNVFLTTINSIFLKTAPIDFYKNNLINIKKC